MVTHTASTTASDYWRAAREMLDGLPSGGLNIAHEAVDRHVDSGHGDQVAIRWLGKSGAVEQLSYADLSARTNRFANALSALGVIPGERVFVLLGRVPALYVAVLGSLKHGAVVCSLFSQFGPEPIRQRIDLGDGRVLVTTPQLYERKVRSIRPELPGLTHVVVVGDDVEDDPALGLRSFVRLLAAAPDRRAVAHTGPEDPALLHFTSGTTGTPKGVLHVHGAVTAHHVTGQTVLDLRRDDRYWCTADPGWVTGTSYGIISPLTNRTTMLVDEAEFDAERWYSTLERERVTVWYTAPTALRMLMKAGTEMAKRFDLRALRVVASVGEPLNPEVVLWGRDAFGLDILDNWWQTETGGIMIANRPGMAVKPGSMGRPLPGIDAAILRRDDAGELALDDAGGPIPEGPGVTGELALRRGWPSMFREYIGMPERYARCFAGEWYRTGDLARLDDDGYYWFVGRGDDVIKSAGHLIGPFEVESTLMGHPAVAEAAVIGLPDPVIGEVVQAYVVLKHGVAYDDALARDLMAHARRHLGPAVAPRAIAVRDALPRTRSGKIMRRLLRARELGLPEGDTSTLEGQQ